MGLFSLDNILLENGNNNSSSSSVIDIDNIGYVDKAVQEHSFVQDGYDAILEMNAMYCNAEKEFYTRILGSCGDNNIINEGFSNFFDSIKKIIKKFIEWIKKIFKEFVAKLAALVGSEKYIKKHKDLFNKFSSVDQFEFQGYNFTNVADDDIPKSKAVEMFESDSKFNKAFQFDAIDFTGTDKNSGGVSDAVIGFFKSGSGEYYDDANKYNSADFSSWTEPRESGDESAIAGRKTATNTINTTLDKRIEAIKDNASDFREKFRAYVIGKVGNETYDSTEFSEALFEVFRDGESSTETITIDYNYVQDAYRRFDKYKEVSKAIEKKKNEMVKDYEDLEKHLEKYIKYNKDNHKVDYNISGRDYTTSTLGRIGKNNNIIFDQSTADKMSSLLKVYSTRVNDMCQIHTQAFTAKLEACKDCFKQDKQILNKAIQQVLKRSNKEDF